MANLKYFSQFTCIYYIFEIFANPAEKVCLTVQKRFANSVYMYEQKLFHSSCVVRILDLRQHKKLCDYEFSNHQGIVLTLFFQFHYIQNQVCRIFPEMHAFPNHTATVLYNLQLTRSKLSFPSCPRISCCLTAAIRKAYTTLDLSD